MICMPALNLFFYNCLLAYIAREVQRIIIVPATSVSRWNWLPIVGRFIAPQQAKNQIEGFPLQELGDILWNVNLYVNCLLLLPALFQLHHFSLLVALILMWNFYVFQRLFVFFLRLVANLWGSDLRWSYYGPLVVFGALMSTLHLGLIIGTMKLQTKHPEEPEPQPDSLPQQVFLQEPQLFREDASENIGDGPRR
ncbi:uncharacterized protein LOC108088757 [Drosophila ficusphila]|uniref:uncharacterized protein LOC108088757 n=1 Tax=Drosophila ficusphila TaxID=30025 RepID=UPI0007E739F2|nr:uncharacterized protein LOC108088757 [Drosophila ficusphila]